MCLRSSASVERALKQFVTSSNSFAHEQIGAAHANAVVQEQIAAANSNAVVHQQIAAAN
jgi:hypothetical protein